MKKSYLVSMDIDSNTSRMYQFESKRKLNDFYKYQKKIEKYVDNLERSWMRDHEVKEVIE